MSVYLHVDDEDPEFLASTTGWGDVIRWVDSLSGFPALSHLAAQGWVEPAVCIVEEAPDALRAHPPAAEVRRTVVALSRLCNTTPTGIAVVGGGFTE